ncbi:3-hydroxy-3-methylglutaryl-coenzyme A reductase [Aliiruegeria haliotis]|uniref:hydroxymethylglutaryl-CoA reductase (NADPH) n=1 Tax=Aliiruegeria haliotis TaxID=1280846 RepID=A0A2T0RUY2_9RHOB|nr:hydroxymethylglutaryl-CoA reductase [Aliiruegeria haliotis]PRY24863.1 3-hydroxy-3-methylglutaryl-coenzyme A reductase [Aliiruegeria haliotis]
MIVPNHVLEMLKRVRALYYQDGRETRMLPDDAAHSPFRGAQSASAASITGLWEALRNQGKARGRSQSILADPETLANAETYSGNIENMIGTVKVPVGVVGPLRVRGLHADGDFHLPLATTEAALVASYGRGALAATRSGGISTAVLYEGVLRSPAFVFDSLLNAGRFVDWVVTQVDDLRAAAEATTAHGRLVSLEPIIDNNVVFLLCRFTTGEAAGQNMVTIATDALCRKAVDDCPAKPLRWYVEGNFSGDKKATSLGTLTGRGRKVSASVTLPEQVVQKVLRTDIDAMLDYGRVAGLGALLSGQFGAQAHYANALAAFYIATGQDAACVAESAVGFTRIERREDGLFCSVTLPNILVGTVGGGTALPSQRAARSLLGLEGPGSAAALAEVTAALCLCGEISIVAAMSAGHFTSAHRKLARTR